MRLRHIILFFFFTITLYAQTIEKFDYFIDESTKLTIEDISPKTLDKTSKNGFVLGAIKGNLWIKLPIKNTKEKEYILSLNEGFYEIFEIYSLQNKAWAKYETSIFHPLEKREISSNILLLPFEIAPTQNEIYIKLHTRFNYFGKLELFTTKEYLQKGTNTFNALLPLFFGILILIGLLNILLYIFFKEKIYLYYVGYTIASITFYSINTGMIVYLGLEKYTFNLYFITVFIMIFLLLFTRELFETKDNFPKIYIATNIFLLWFVFLAIMLSITHRPWNNIFNLSIIFINLSFVVFSINMYFKKHTTALLYLTGIIVYLFGTVMLALMAMGINEYSEISRHSLFLGSLIEIILFQAALMKRQRTIKEIKDKAQNELINLQHKTQQELELKVKDRTAQIEAYAKEKELLLKEVHHRVKNNFHSLISMLWIDDQNHNSNHNQKLINQLQAISSIHEKLYGSKDVNSINMKEYLEELIDNAIISSMKNIEVRKDIESIELNFEESIGMGIVVNELLTNAIKHNADSKNLILTIEFKKQNNKSILKFSDNGQGFDINNSRGFGLILIKEYISELQNATYNFNSNNGCHFYLEFKNENKV